MQDEVTTGGEIEGGRRRRWSCADKQAAVELAFGEGGDVAAVAASVGVEPSRLHSWRRRIEAARADAARSGDPLFLPAVVAAGASDEPSSDLVTSCGAISLHLDDVRIMIGRDARPAVVTALVIALRESR